MSKVIRNLVISTLDGKIGKVLGEEIMEQLKTGKSVKVGKLGYSHTQVWPEKGRILMFSPTPYAIKKVNNGNGYGKQ